MRVNSARITFEHRVIPVNSIGSLNWSIPFRRRCFLMLEINELFSLKNENSIRFFFFAFCPTIHLMYGKHLKIFLSSEHMFEIRMPKKNNSFHTHTHKIKTANEFFNSFELHSLQFVLHDGQYEFEFMHLRVSKIFSFYHKINISSLTHR